MLNQKMLNLGENRSVIREIFEYGNKRRAEIGAENVFDFRSPIKSFFGIINLCGRLSMMENEIIMVSLYSHIPQQNSMPLIMN